MKKILNNKNKIGLWRKFPPAYEGSSKERINFIFPSGRQAIAVALAEHGLERNDLVATPEWSSHCVISAIGKVATPIIMGEVIKNDIKVSGVLLYEQWGWPIIESSKEQILKRFKDALIILDRADSADINNKKRLKFYPEHNEAEIISFSKILGLSGGGLLKINGNYKKFKFDAFDKLLSKKLSNLKTNDKIREFYKNEIKFLNEDLKKWLENNNLFSAVEQECLRRENNLDIILNDNISRAWKKWMIEAIKNGSRPGIAPFFIDAPAGKIKKAEKIIEKKFGVESKMYHFNLSGNPLKPDYKRCLAFPINGLVREVEEILKEINKIN